MPDTNTANSIQTRRRFLGDALRPERCKAHVSVSGYLIGKREANKTPLPPKAELEWWYQFYFATERGRLGYEKYTRDFNKLIWRLASLKWSFDDATFERTAASFDNPDHVAIVVHNYRWRIGLSEGEPKWMYDYNNGEPERLLNKDEMLDDITLYWLTNTATSSARLYWETMGQSVLLAAAQKTSDISLPVAITVFPEEVYRAPETWARRAYGKLIYFNEVDKGGHFAAWEQPELFAAELRAAFRSLRPEHSSGFQK